LLGCLLGGQPRKWFLRCTPEANRDDSIQE
jgi:hypothetical protein